MAVQAGELLRMKLVVEQTAFAANEVCVEVVGLQTIDDRRRLADAAVLELQNGGRRRAVFVGGEDRVRALGRIARDFIDLCVHAEEQRIDRMATGGQERAAAQAALRVPAILAVPRSDAVV